LSATQVIAHRGASKAEPENTVAAFRRAASMGSHAVELDVRRTLDGVLVVHHNPILDDGRVIAECGFADLPEHVCTLDEALDACRPMWVNVEIKNDPTEPDFDSTESIADDTIACLLERSEGDERWVISSFRRETIARCHELRPSIATAWLTVEVKDRAECVAWLRDGGHSALHPWFGFVDAALIDEFHAAGLRVNVWTCDDPDKMRDLVAWGIDGICTNVPDVALTIV
jgi:glycerophosphoryl diester phosphodiesterase